jgi:D-alanyl-D-alanine carboxypeptidase
MNAEARRLGMNSTHYNNPNGLPDAGQVTTARDLAVLAHAIWTEFPQYRDLFRIAAIRTGDRVIRTHNALIERYRGSNGMKTGFICASGFNVVASATRNGKTLIAVVLGSDTAKERTELAAKLLDRGFSGVSLESKSLATFASGAAIGSPVDMRDQVCKRRNAQEGEEELDPVLASVTGSASSLEPKRFFVMDPVAVSTLYVPPQPDPPVKKSKSKGKTAKKGKAGGDKSATAKTKGKPVAAKPSSNEVADAPAKPPKKKLILQ